jgi:3-oxoacyl-[acyl-carrier protein] reductase
MTGTLRDRYIAGEYRHAADQAGRTVDDEIEVALRTIPAGRFGRPREIGAACAFLCSSQAGYLTEQNLVLDGGEFPGML